MPVTEAGPTRAEAGRGARWAAAFVLCALAFSWTPWLLVLWTTGDPAASPAAEALWFLGGLGPALAAAAVAGLSAGREGLRRLGRGLLRWRLGRWYLLLLAPLPVAVAAVGLTVMTGEPGFDVAAATQWLLVPALLLGGVLLGGLEEVGWRGYLQPALQHRRSALVASLVIGLVWAVWHAPLFLLEGTTQATASPLWFAVQALGLSVVLGWVYNATNGSTLFAVLLHGAVNGWYSAAVQLLAPATLATFLPFAALLSVVAAVAVVWVYGAHDLARQPRQVWPPRHVVDEDRRS